MAEAFPFEQTMETPGMVMNDIGQSKLGAFADSSGDWFHTQVAQSLKAGTERQGHVAYHDFKDKVDAQEQQVKTPTVFDKWDGTEYMPLYDHANQLHNQMDGLASKIYMDERQSYRDLEAKTVGFDFKRLETDYDELENMIKDRR